MDGERVGELQATADYLERQLAEARRELRRAIDSQPRASRGLAWA